MAKKILIIEDEKTLRFLLAQSLIAAGFQVEEAVDGEEGIKKMKENKPDLVLLDLILPTMHGFDVLIKIKKDPFLESVPVMILSNLGQKEEVDKGLELGAVDFLIKAHFSLDEIIEKVKKTLSSY